ncbi:MAG: UDP-2,3-diacylglucosamine diphosphatase [Dokdonella sp.]
MTTLFISDLHLDASRPHITDLFVEFVRKEAVRAKALYILGDLFEAWIGDDNDDGTATQVADALADLRRHGVPCFFIHGNRDFLLGDAFARRAGMTLLPDPSTLEIEGQRILLMHGDTLCTNDAPYQAFRAQSHTPAWQRAFLGKPVVERRAFAQQARAESQRYTRSVANGIADVNPEAVLASLRTADVRLLVHGHTHRPATHHISNEERLLQRIVLGDWYEQGSVLRIEFGGIDQLSLKP